MPPFFTIAPWEYAGADFDGTPHAIVRATVKGRGKTWWLRVRNGLIYFRDAARMQVFAVPQRFDDLDARDAETLVAHWKEAIARDDFGLHLMSRRLWPGTRAASNFCLVLRADGSGTIREHFDRDWRPFQLELAKPLDLWRSHAFGDEIERIVKPLRTAFLERAVDALHFQTVPEQWRRGCIADADAQDELRRVMTSAMRLWAPPDYYVQPFILNCHSNSEFFAGSVGDGLVFDSHVRLRQIWDMAKWHYGYVGVQWQRASENAELREQYGPRIWQRNFDKYGEDWRGNWVGQPFRSALELPAIGRASAHEKLEAALFLRAWLQGKVPDAKVEAWLAEALA